MRWSEVRGGGVLASIVALALSAGCRVGQSTPPPDAAPAPAPVATEPAPDVDALVAASDLPDVIEAPLPDDPMAVTIHRLSNGMTVYISTDRQEPRFSARIGVRAGSRMDPADSTGLAHYLEHMLFKGTHRFGTLDPEQEAPHVQAVAELYDQLRMTTDPQARAQVLARIDARTQAMAAYAVPNEIDRMYAALGVEGVNAFTSVEQTVYLGNVPANRLEAWAAIEGERFADPVFRLFLPELEAVYEEKNISLDEPSRRVHEVLERALFPEHPYGTQTTIGEAEHLKNPAYGDMVEYFERWYVPNNMAVVLAGDIDAATALPVLEATLGQLRAGPVPALPEGRLPPLTGRVFRSVEADGEEQVTLAWHAPPAGHADVPVLEVMDRVLDNGRVGLLNVQLELTQRVPSAGSYLSTYHEAGAVVMRADARAGQTPEQLEGMLLEVVGKLKAGEFTEQDVTAAKLQESVIKERRLEFPAARSSHMMDAFIMHRQWADVVEEDQRFGRVTRDDVIRVANQYLGDAYVVVAKRKGTPEIPKLDKPEITPVEIDPSRSSAFARAIEAMPVTPLEPQWVVEGEDYGRRTLPAGDLITGKNERNELFSLTYQQKRGYRKAPLLCYALELFALSGAGDDDAETVQKQIYALGTTISTSCNSEWSSITIEGLDGQLEASLAILDRWLASPRFDREVLARLHDNTVSERRDGMDKDWVLAAALNDFARYGEHSAWLHQPSNRMLKQARPAALRRLISEFFDHEHHTLYFGPREAEAVAPVVARGKRHRKTGEPWVRRYREVEGPAVVFLHDEGAKADVRFTLPQPPLTRDARPTAELLSEYLSGNMSALIFQEIREARGLAYTARSSYSVGRRPSDASSLSGTMSTQADKTPEAVRTFLELMRSSVIQPERLASAKQSLDQQYRTNRIDPRWVNRWVLNWDELGEPRDPRPWEWTTIEQTGVADVEAFTKAFAGAPVIVAIVGDRARVGLEELAEIGPVQEVKVEDLFSYGAFPPVEGSEEEAETGRPGKKR